MLSEQESELLTAYLDGQLSARQRKAAVRLLQRSPEARKLLQKLQDDAHSLRRLPVRKLSPDFSLKLMRTIAERGLQPGGARPLPRPRGLPTWVGVAAAAAVLLLVAGGSYVYFGDRLGGSQGVIVESVQVAPQPLPPRLDPFVGGLVANITDQYLKPVRDGRYYPLPDLNQQAGRSRLAKELQSRPAHHLVLENGNNVRAVERLAAAFEGSKIKVLMDPVARQRLQKKQPKTTYVVYAENVRPDELAAILQHFGRHTRPGERLSENVLLNPMTGKDRESLSKLLGVPPAQLEKVPLSEPVFVPKEQPGKKGRLSQPAPKNLERFAVVLATNAPAGNPHASKEIQRFLASRGQPRPGTVQVYLVLHEASA